MEPMSPTLHLDQTPLPVKFPNRFPSHPPLIHHLITDMMGSFIQTMDMEVDSFAAAVKADPKLAGGFNAIGYSQGALTIRGYIEK